MVFWTSKGFTRANSFFSHSLPCFNQFSSLSQLTLKIFGDLAICGGKKRTCGWKFKQELHHCQENGVNTAFITWRCSSTAGNNQRGFTVWKDQVLHLYHLNRVGLNASAFSSAIHFHLSLILTSLDDLQLISQNHFLWSFGGRKLRMRFLCGRNHVMNKLVQNVVFNFAQYTWISQCYGICSQISVCILIISQYT